ncbi:hypothetical protein D5085_07615 [Ectothiorhodospiraceae bacterium BW-2]|nr:hypothetical protein D5085_07615 [Ectothiorhodospiraceae bacterium BW-2]
MSRIVPNITTLEQHHQQLQADPERYRPDDCPHCGKTQLWSHGVYFRYPDRGLESQGAYNPCRRRQRKSEAVAENHSSGPSPVDLAAQRHYGGES